MSASDIYEDRLSKATALQDVGEKYFNLQALYKEAVQQQQKNLHLLEKNGRLAEFAGPVFGGSALVAAISPFVPAAALIGFGGAILLAVTGIIGVQVLGRSIFPPTPAPSGLLQKVSAWVQKHLDQKKRAENERLSTLTVKAQQEIIALEKQTAAQTLAQSARLSELMTVPAFVEKLRAAFKPAAEKVSGTVTPAAIAEPPKPAV